ncbi:MAG: TatD family hydrolase [Acidobacteriaceae bacterium]|nr:TatD family hydrolase [Acidobacteriaceae bacterium]MBV9296984.1 TatD family hydrolase [Acidobacteriaceae bacterium]MBV9765602.1 TatD family hydrolase [Acidobacteriaceae bacterium]
MLCDSHCHLDDSQFDVDRTDVIQRAREAGLKYMLTIGTGNGPPDLEAGVRLANEHPFLFATVGVHPNDAPKLGSSTYQDLERLLMHPKVKAIGEIGLDYHWGVPKGVQLPVFIRQLEIASQARMPVIIHTRDAWSDTLGVLRVHWAPTGLPCVMHCFTGNVEKARECLDLGFYLAFGGVTTFPKASSIREAARITPSHRLLLETDSPYLAPVPYRGKRNEPAFVAHTAQVIAELRGISVVELGAFTTANFEQLFQIHRPEPASEAHQLH